jgi:hypothetical protein
MSDEKIRELKIDIGDRFAAVENRIDEVSTIRPCFDDDMLFRVITLLGIFLFIIIIIIHEIKNG